MEKTSKQVVVDYDEYQKLLEEHKLYSSGDNILIIKYNNSKIHRYGGSTNSFEKYPFPTIIKGCTEIEEFFKLKNDELEEVIHMYLTKYKCKNCARSGKVNELSEIIDLEEIKEQSINNFNKFIIKLKDYMNKLNK